MKAVLPRNEAARLETLHQYQILDTEPEQAYDDLTRLAAHICGTPIALISLVDNNRQWFKSKVGLTVQETARDLAFCAHAIMQKELLIVRDALADERFANNTLVTSEPNIRFYAGAPLISSNGLALGTLCVIDYVPRDLSPQQIEALQILSRQVVAQLELRRRERELSDFLENGAVGMHWVGPDGKILWANQAELDLLGYSREEYVGHAIANFHADPEVIDDILHRLSANETLDNYEARLRCKDGSIRYVLINSNVFWEEDQFIHSRCFTRDITERKRAEQKIREQAALLDVATDAIFVLDMNNQILFWNKGAELLYGWKAIDVIGKDASELLYREPQIKKNQKTLADSGLCQGELHQVTKDGKKITVESRWTLVRDDEEKSKSILVVNTDITEKKQFEKQFLRTQRMESIGTLAGGIAHDLNNVLSPILMTVQLLEMKLHDKQSRQWLNILETNAKRGAALVKQVLSFARGIEGEHSILQVKHLIAEMKHTIQQTFPKFIQVYTNIPRDLWTVSGDSTQLHQVLMNLCVNARDAMPNGGTLRISAENLFVDNHYARMHLDARVGSYIVLTVSDTGTGIPPEIVDKIFEPFFTTKDFGKGTGLGLSTVMGIIKSHGGFVNVASEVGKGTQFKVYLPAVKATETQQVDNSEIHTGNGEVILVVDDEAAIREITKTSLETFGYKVLTASDGIEAVALYAQHKDEISVVLVDMMMPVMDGATTIRTLQKINPQVKIVANSGVLSIDKFVEAQKGAGIKAFLSKPYTAKELLKTLQGI